MKKGMKKVWDLFSCVLISKINGKEYMRKKVNA